MATRNGINVEACASQSRGKDEIAKGKVGEVRQQFQVHEDTALAYKLQSEEIEHHVSRNRQERKSVRDSVKTAKETFLEEVKYAGVLPENSVAEIEQKQWLAEELHRRVEDQENMARAQEDEQKRKDERIALEIQREEEKMLRYYENKRLQKLAKAEEEHRRLRKAMRDLEAAKLSEYNEEEKDIRTPEDNIELPEATEIITLADGTVIDAKQNEVQTEEQKLKHMQKRDAELAKILQEQEDHQIEKQKNIHEDLRKAIELQDREIAKHLQRQEKSKAERRREKIRRGQSLPERDELVSGNRRHLPTYHEATVPTEVDNDDDRRETGKNTSYREDSEKRTKSLDDRRLHHRIRSHGEADDNSRTARDSDPRASGAVRVDEDPGAHYDNVVETLDPTFRRPPRQPPPYMGEDDDELQAGNKSAQLVPPLKRKSSRDKSKKDCKQQ